MQPAPPTQPKESSPARRRRWLYIVLPLLVFPTFAASWIFWPVSAPPLQIARDTTFLSGPVNPDGTINYVAAINEITSKGVTPENNAAVLILRALGPELIDAKVRSTLLQQLGVDVTSAGGNYFLPIADFVRGYSPAPAQTPNDQADASQESNSFEIERRYLSDHIESLTPKDRALVRAWLCANEQALARIVAATQKSRFFVPLCSPTSPPHLMDATGLDIRRLHMAGKALGLRAQLHAVDGDLQQAWEDSWALHYLARLCGQQPTLMGRLVSVGFDDLASSVEVQIAHHPDLTADHARAILAQLQTLPELPDMVDAIDVAERCLILDGIMQVMRAPARLSNGGTVPAHLTGKIDFNLILRRANTAVDASLAPLRVTDYSRRQLLLKRQGEDFRRSVDANHALVKGLLGTVRFLAVPPRMRLQLRSEAIGDMLLSLTMPSLGYADNHRLQAAMRRQLSQIAFALSAWHAETGSHPETLTELVPDYLPQVPMDLFTGHPLVYQPSESGYLLYSVGKNGKDDAGNPADDIVVQTPSRPVPATAASQGQAS